MINLKHNKRLATVWDRMTPTEKERFAKLVGRPKESLIHVVRGRRGIDARLAIKLERAASRMGTPLNRTQLCDECAKCEYARTCLQWGEIPLKGSKP